MRCGPAFAAHPNQRPNGVAYQVVAERVLTPREIELFEQRIKAHEIASAG